MATFVVLLSSLVASWVQGAQVRYYDGDFTDLSWHHELVKDTGPAPANIEVNSGDRDSIEIVHQWTGPGAIQVFHWHDALSVSPQSLGGISNISCIYDFTVIEPGSSGGVKTAPAIKQGDKVYISRETFTLTELEKERTLRFENLKAEDFQSIDSPDVEHPDFSKEGWAFQIGFITSNGRSFPGATMTRSVVDNWNSWITGPSGSNHFEDTGFNITIWESKVVIADSPGSVAFEAKTEGETGNTGNFRSVEHDWDGPGKIAVAHLRNGSTYDPALTGTIDSIQFSFDLKIINAQSSGGVAYSGLIEQAGSIYVTPSSLVELINIRWADFDLPTYQATDFAKVEGDGPNHPDFSSTAAPLQFGYYTSNGTQTPKGNTSSGIDNWTATVVFNPPSFDDPVLQNIRIEDGKIIADLTYNGTHLDIYRTETLPGFSEIPHQRRVQNESPLVLDSISTSGKAFYYVRPSLD